MKHSFCGCLEQPRGELQPPTCEVGERRFAQKLRKPLVTREREAPVSVASLAIVQGWRGRRCISASAAPTTGSLAPASQLDRFEVRCRLLPYVVPNPSAL